MRDHAQHHARDHYGRDPPLTSRSIASSFGFSSAVAPSGAHQRSLSSVGLLTVLHAHRGCHSLALQWHHASPSQTASMGEHQAHAAVGSVSLAAGGALRLVGPLHVAVAVPPTTPGRRGEGPPPAAESTVVAGINAQHWGAMGVPFAAVDVLGSEDGAVLAVRFNYCMM